MPDAQREDLTGLLAVIEDCERAAAAEYEASEKLRSARAVRSAACSRLNDFANAIRGDHRANSEGYKLVVGDWLVTANNFTAVKYERVRKL